MMGTRRNDPAAPPGVREARAASSAPGRFPFGLSAEDERRATRLHEAAIVFDGVNQHPGGSNIFAELPAERVRALLDGGEGFAGLGRAVLLPYELAAGEGSDVVRRWWRESGVDVGTAAVPVNLERFDASLYRKVADIFDRLGWLRPVTTAREIRDNKRAGIVSLWGYDQPIYGIPSRITSITDAYARGLRTLMLTYNRMDYVGQGCTERVDAGLSRYGLEVVRACNDLGIIVDTSHCGRRTTLDACEHSKAPVIANHTSARAVYGHARGKSDEEIHAIAATGGLVGIVTVPYFLAPGPRPTVEAVLDHIDHVARLVGTSHVAIGTDWPMQAPLPVLETTLGAMLEEVGFRPEDRVSVAETLAGFEDYRDMPNITRGLVARGYTDDEITAILGGNHLRVIERVCGG